MVRNADEGRAAVRELVARGVDCIKVYDRVGAAALTGIREAAHELGVPVMGHVPFDVPFPDAHISDVQHLTGVASLVDPRWSNYGEMADAWRALDEDAMDSVVRTSLDQGVAHTPTLVVFEQLSRLVSYDRLVTEPSVQLLPRFWREIGWNPRFDPGLRRLPAAERQRLLEHDYTDILLREKELVRRLHAAGVRIHAGTDVPNPFVVPGVSLHEEMRLLLGCGLEPMEAWAAATRWPGQWLHEPLLGTLEPGAPADLLVFREDPTRNLAELSTLEAVVADGRFYSVEELER